MQLTRPVSQQDVDQFQAADAKLQAIGIDTDNPAYTDPIINYLNQNPNIPITADLIVNFVNQHKQLFTWRNAVQQEYDQLAANFSERDTNQIAAGLKKFGYWTDNEQDDLSNWNVTAKAYNARFSGLPVTDERIKLVIGNLLNSPQGHKLIQKMQPKKFDSAASVKEHEAKKNTVQREEGPYFDPISGTTIRPVTGVLKAHSDMLHSKTETITPEPENLDQQMQRKAEALVSSIQSNNDRAEAEQILKNAGGWGWPLTLRSIELYIQRRAYERSVAGR
jgi:hypothetical protein